MGVVEDVRGRLSVDGAIHVGQRDVGLAGPALALEKERAAARTAEAATRPGGRGVPTHLVLTRREAELIVGHPEPGHEGGAVRPPAQAAVAVGAPLGRSRDLETNRAAETTAGEGFFLCHGLIVARCWMLRSTDHTDGHR